MLRVRVAFSGGMQGPGLATHYFTGTTQTEATSAGAAVAAFWLGTDNLRSSSCLWSTLAEVASLDEATGKLVGLFTITPTGGTGAQGADQLAKSSQGLIRWRTGVFSDGKEIRGHTFIPAPTEVHNAAGGPVGTYTGDLKTAGDALIAHTAPLLVWRQPKKEDGVIVRPGSSAVVTTCSAWSQWAVLRSRRD